MRAAPNKLLLVSLLSAIPLLIYFDGLYFKQKQGAQWLSGRVLDSRRKGRGFKPHRCHCVVSLSKNINPSLVLVQTRKTHPYITDRLLMGCKESNQTKKISYKMAQDPATEQPDLGS